MLEQIQSGRYVVAVSGGVDSVALLNMLSKRPQLELVVAHFDHGIRPDSAEDLRFVEALAASYNLPFVGRAGKLGAGASEATARTARYDFLHEVMREHQAQAIITAHHQDDLLETAMLNLLRGTGRKGLTALQSRPGITRPLLAISKAKLKDYALQHQLEWREDSTNLDQKYLRNYIRHSLVSRLDADTRQGLLRLLDKQQLTNQAIDALLVKYLAEQGSKALQRAAFVQLPHDVAKEVLAAWLRQHELRDFDRRLLERLTVAAKTGRPGQRFPIRKNHYLVIQKDSLALQPPERWANLKNNDIMAIHGETVPE